MQKNFNLIGKVRRIYAYLIYIAVFNRLQTIH